MNSMRNIWVLALFILLAFSMAFSTACGDDDDDDNSDDRMDDDDDITDDDDDITDDDDDTADDDDDTTDDDDDTTDDDDDTTDDDDDVVDDDDDVVDDDDDVVDDDDDVVDDDDDVVDDDDDVVDDDDDTTTVIADAGDEQDVENDVTVNLTGSGSTGATTYLWEQIAGFPVEIDDPTQADTTFTSPGLTGPESIQMQLTVSDGGSNDTDVVTINVYPNLTDSFYYVDANAKEKSGTGTRLNPFTTLDEALAVATYQTFIYIAEGTYTLSGELEMPNGTHLFGGFKNSGDFWQRDTQAYPTILQDTQTGANCVSVSFGSTTFDAELNGLVISGNDCGDTSFTVVVDDTSARLMFNKIYTGDSSTADKIGVLLSGDGVSTMLGNVIITDGGSSNIGLSISDTNAGSFFDNAIFTSIGGTGTTTGLYLNTALQPMIVHNTIGSKPELGTAAARAVFLSSVTENSIWVNNLLFTVGSGSNAYCMVEDAGGGLYQINNNLLAGCANLYLDGGGTTVTDIAAFNVNALMDATINGFNIVPDVAQTLDDVLVGEGGLEFDFHLVDGSPAIDAGHVFDEPLAIDYEGKARTDTADIGCDEYGN